MKRFFSDMDPDKKSTILKYTGIAVLVFAFFTLLSALSYLFTWQADQSLLSNPEPEGTKYWHFASASCTTSQF